MGLQQCWCQCCSRLRAENGSTKNQPIMDALVCDQESTVHDSTANRQSQNVLLQGPDWPNIQYAVTAVEFW